MDELRTCDSILSWLKTQTESKRPIDPNTWMDAAMALNILSSEENDKLIDLESELAVNKAIYLNSGKTVAACKVLIEASPEYKEVRRQRAKMVQIQEAIRLSKKNAQIKSDEMRSGL